MVAPQTLHFALPNVNTPQDWEALVKTENQALGQDYRGSSLYSDTNSFSLMLFLYSRS